MAATNPAEAGRVHVVGAGLAGVAAALSLSAAGRAVTVHEAAPSAGGRCRSYFDRELGLTIDNGNHLLLSGNGAAMAYLRETGAGDALGGPAQAVPPFVDVGSGRGWALRINAGRLPWWILLPSRRVPGTRVWDYLPLAALGRVRDDRSVAELLPRSLLFERLLEPLAIAALNTPPEQGLGRLLGAVVRETLMRGGAACVPRFPRESLAAAFVDPAVGTLRARGVELRFGHRISGLEIAAGRVTGLAAANGMVPVRAVVLAVPPWVASDLVPGLVAPDEFQAILNIHFRVDADPGPAGFYGLIGGTAEWVFVKPGHVSVTISAANRMVDQAAEAIARAVWLDVRAVLGLAGEMPACRVVKERRATFAATAAQERRRPGPRTAIVNLALAGDWTATGLPATIEGAIRSGRRAAEMILSECLTR